MQFEQKERSFFLKQNMKLFLLKCSTLHGSRVREETLNQGGNFKSHRLYTG